ncbi:helix-turn-helix domain-containing protein [Microbacterium deminutum]|uniref:TetR/AcrR family transcriptional regulator n=1 Tax=Microbacterium deminutum TaxID=344164 RepID=A0ABP5CGH0_9MICO
MTEVPSETKPRRRRLTPEARKAEILDVTLALLAEKGYWGLTFADVAKGAGVTFQAVLHYFPTKDDLMRGVLSRRDEVDIRSVAPDDHPVHDAVEFTDIIARLIARNAERPELIRLYAVLSAESLHPSHPAHGYFRERQATSLRELRDLARTWYDDPDELALQVNCELDGLQIFWLRDRTVDMVARWRTWARNYLGVKE